MSTFAQLESNVKRRLRDSGNVTWNPTEIQGAINEVYQEFCAETHILRDSTTVTISANDGLYAMPTVTGVSEIIRIWRAEWDDCLLTVTNTYKMDSMFGAGWRDDTGSTLTYIMTDAEDPTQIRVYPMISDDDYIGDLVLNIDFSYIPSAMTSGTSPAIPTRYHVALEYGAVAQLQELPVSSRQNPAMGDRALAHYRRLVGRAKMEVAEGLSHNYDTHVLPQAI